MEHVVDFLREVVRADQAFFHGTLRQMDENNAGRTMARYMSMRQAMYEILGTLLEPPPPPVQMQLHIPANWEEPVPVIATPAQQEHAMIHLALGNPPSQCAICQDSIQQNGVQLRNCGHPFHRNCVTQWFTTSPRCPVCRNDIRDAED